MLTDIFSPRQQTTTAYDNHKLPICRASKFTPLRSIFIQCTSSKSWKPSSLQLTLSQPPILQSVNTCDIFIFFFSSSLLSKTCFIRRKMYYRDLWRKPIDGLPVFVFPFPHLTLCVENLFVNSAASHNGTVYGKTRTFGKNFKLFSFDSEIVKKWELKKLTNLFTRPELFFFR